jgi:DnaJ-class molecular chaperone
MKEIISAHKVLIDSVERIHYDRHLLKGKKEEFVSVSLTETLERIKTQKELFEEELRNIEEELRKNEETRQIVEELEQLR